MGKDTIRSTRQIRWGGRALRERLDFAVRSRLRPSSFAPMRMLSARPIVLHVRDFAFRPGSPIFRLLRALRDRPVDLLCSPSWNQARRRRIEKLMRLQWRLQRTGDHRITFLANSEAELKLVRRAGIPTLHVNNAAFLDERIFRPLPDRRVRFDAVYDARFSRFKRHQLAAEVPNLALITYLLRESEPDYRAAVAEVLARAHIFNGDPVGGDYRLLPPEEVNQALSQCAVGLALSREEGAMYASLQYLLAGLPVVSTWSEGGRDDFYHPDYVRIVDATPRAVAEAVSALGRCPVAPEEIRARSLARVWEHRERLFQCIDEIYARRGCDRKFAAEWPSLFANKLLHELEDPTAEVLAAIEGAHAR